MLGIAKACGGLVYDGKGKNVPVGSLRAGKFTKIDTLHDGTISKDFTSNTSPAQNRLAPIIFSHGISSSRGMHTGSCRDFASHGYIAFIMDHKDESCSYTESEDGTNGMVYNNHNILHALEYRKNQLKIRV